jgi:DNA repair protein RecN (Recombination protein N)
MGFKQNIQGKLPLMPDFRRASLEAYAHRSDHFMLSHLFVRDFAIIPSLELDFQPGFTVITGETGAGKSILVDALGLLLGKRSDSSWVRQGSAKAELTAEFTLEDNPAATKWLLDAGLDSDDHCLLRRSIADSGRSRAWINGSPVTVQQLSHLGNLLVEIHGQNEHVQLTSPARQFVLLDGSGKYLKELDKTQTAFNHWQQLQSEYDELEQQSGLAPAEMDYLGFQLGELEANSIPATAVAKLEQEHRKLAQGGALVDALDFSAASLNEDDKGILSMIHHILSRMHSFNGLDPAIDEACAMLKEAAVNCEEASNRLGQARDRTDLSPERLAAVTLQLGVLADLARKHQVPMEELEQVKERLAARVAGAENFEHLQNEMQQKCDGALSDYRSAAALLSKKRTHHASTLSAAVSELMAGLGMPGGIMEIRILHDANSRPSGSGDDTIEILVSTNPGTSPAPLAKIASGGELSRISLAIKVASSTQLNKTQVFDEVDAGIGGDTANAVGILLQKLSQDSQALCVTHLAQVAVCAGHQVQVRKEAMENSTAVDTHILGRDERVDEIARMLGGRISAQSREHAREMLSAARLH